MDRVASDSRHRTVIRFIRHQAETQDTSFAKSEAGQRCSVRSGVEILFAALRQLKNNVVRLMMSVFRHQSSVCPGLSWFVLVSSDFF